MFGKRLTHAFPVWSLSPRMQAEIRSRAHGNAQPHMRRKLSMSLAFALLALLLAATAGAAAYFGVTRFHAEQGKQRRLSGARSGCRRTDSEPPCGYHPERRCFRRLPVCPLRWTFRTAAEHRPFTCIRASPRFRTGNKSAPPSSASSASPKISPSAHFPRCTAGAFYDGILLILPTRLV